MYDIKMREDLIYARQAMEMIQGIDDMPLVGMAHLAVYGPMYLSASWCVGHDNVV